MVSPKIAICAKIFEDIIRKNVIKGIKILIMLEYFSPVIPVKTGIHNCRMRDRFPLSRE
jgi:hypothetical protein